MKQTAKQRKLANIITIQEAVAEKYGIDRERLISKNRTDYFVLPRHIAIYLSREMAEASLEVIGNMFMRDHTTVIHAIEKIRKLLKEQKFFQEEMKEVRARVKGAINTKSLSEMFPV